jgi:hypothetical protein
MDEARSIGGGAGLLPIPSRSLPRVVGLTLTGAMVLLLSAIVYLNSLSMSLSGDDIQYVMVIERAVNGGFFYHPAGEQAFIPRADLDHEHLRPQGPPINPRYLAEWPTSVGAVLAWRLMGWQGDAITPILSLRAIVAAYGLMMVFFAVASIVGNRVIAAVAVTGLGSSVAYWTYGTHLDQSINMVAALGTSLFLYARYLPRGGRMVSVLLFLSLVVAALYNMTAVIPAAILCAAWSMGRPGRLADRVGLLIASWGLFGLTVIAVSAAAMLIWGEPAWLGSLDFWRRMSFSGHPEYQVSLTQDAARAVIGLAKSQIEFPGAAGSLHEYWATASLGERLWLVGYHACAILLLTLPLLFLAWRWPALRADPSRRLMLVMLVSCLLAYSGFNLLWDPGYIKYWLVPLMALWGLVAVALAELRAYSPHSYRRVLALAAACVTVGLLVNWTTRIAPQRDPASHPWQAISAELRERLGGPEALFVSPGHPLDFYIAYVTRRDIVAARLVEYATGNSRAEMSRRLTERARQYHALGAPVYLFGLETLSSDEQERLLSLLPGRPRAVWSYPATVIYQIEPPDGFAVSPRTDTSARTTAAVSAHP